MPCPGWALKRTIARPIAGQIRQVAAHSFACIRFPGRAGIGTIAAAVGTFVAIVPAAPPLTVSDQGFVGFLTGLKTGADVSAAAEGAFVPHDFLDRLGTGIAAVQDRIGAAEAFKGRDEFLIENDQQDGEAFHGRMLILMRSKQGKPPPSRLVLLLKHSKSSPGQSE